MDEYIDIVTETGLPTNTTALKSVIHSKGYYHNTAHVWFYTTKGEILLAQRAESKIICPLLWDVSVAGHVDAGETIEEAAVRETQEELGFTINKEQLEKVDVFPCFQSYDNGIIDNEFHHTYISKLSVELGAIQYNTAEVASVKLVSVEEFKSLLEQSRTNGHFIATNKAYYLKVLSCIENTM